MAEEVTPDFVWEEDYSYEEVYIEDTYAEEDAAFSDAEEATEEAEEETEEEEIFTDPAVFDYSDWVEAGGDRIHVIKIFEQRGVADALLLESDGHFAMVDVGLPYDYEFNKAHDTDNSVVNYLKNYGVEYLDFIILTHMHNDHIGNLDSILRSFSVGGVYARHFDCTQYITSFPDKKAVSIVCQEYDVKTSLLTEGQVLQLGNLTLKIMNADDELNAEGENQNCIAILVTDAYGHRALLAGDMNNLDGDEDRLAELHADELANIDYLKLGHHGGTASSTQKFMEMLEPNYITVTGWRMCQDPEPIDNGRSVTENVMDTRAYKQGALFYAYESQNGIIFNMGEYLSINSTYSYPSHKGDANKTLSIYYNANGGSIKDKLSRYCINAAGYICSINKDDEFDNVTQRKAEGDVAPMYYYDKQQNLKEAEDFGLSRLGHSFEGWSLSTDKTQLLNSEDQLDLLEIAPELADDSTYLVLDARWKAYHYNITFYANGGNGSMERQDCTYNKKTALDENRFFREQYVFMGWNTKPDGTGSVFRDGAEIKNLAVNNGDTIKLYAQWKRIGIGTPREIPVKDDRINPTKLAYENVRKK